MAGHVLITGASGVLGRALISFFSSRGLSPVAQYHEHLPGDLPGIWIPADLSTREGVRLFLKDHGSLLRECEFMVHAYGPISRRPLADLRWEDFQTDYNGNVVACHQIVQNLVSGGRLRSIVTIGFSNTGGIQPYRNVLTHAGAKNALLLLTLSLAADCPGLTANMVSFPALPGARIPAPAEFPPVPCETVAAVIADLMLGNRNGIHLQVTAKNPEGEVVHAI